MKKAILLSLLLSTMAFVEESGMKIHVIAIGETLAATLANGEAAKDFYEMLPLELELSDYAGEEKISYLPRKLNTSREPEAVATAVGDINYYAP